MGNQDSCYRLAEYDHRFPSQHARTHPFFGQHQLLLDKDDQLKAVICKPFLFHSNSEYSQFLQAYRSIHRKPFSLVYPRDIIDSPNSELCTTSREVKVYFDIIGLPLLHKVENQGIFSETKAWFLLNQLSKALEVLEESGRAHWAISPETVYCNSYQNYLLYDSFFVLGANPSNFLKNFSAQGAPLIPKVQKILERHSLPSTSDGREQDMYMIGLTIFFVLTGINIRKLPPQPQKQQIIEETLNSLSLSREIKHIVRSLIELSTLRRMDNAHLRRLLKEKEAIIIKNQSIEFLKTKASSQFKVERNMELQEKQREKNIKNYGSRTNLKSSHHEPVSLFASHRPSVQFCIDNGHSQKNYHPVRMAPKVTMTPQRPEQYYRPEPLLSRIHSADIIMRQ